MCVDVDTMNDADTTSLKGAIRELVWCHAPGTMTLKDVENLANHILVSIINWPEVDS